MNTRIIAILLGLFVAVGFSACSGAQKADMKKGIRSFDRRMKGAAEHIRKDGKKTFRKANEKLSK